MDDKKVPYVPFHAINQFMVDTFRHDVIQSVLNGLNQLDGGKRGAYQNLIKSAVKIDRKSTRLNSSHAQL
jgi:hypothetical protein